MSYPVSRPFPSLPKRALRAFSAVNTIFQHSTSHHFTLPCPAPPYPSSSLLLHITISHPFLPRLPSSLLFSSSIYPIPSHPTSKQTMRPQLLSFALLSSSTLLPATAIPQTSITTPPSSYYLRSRVVVGAGEDGDKDGLWVRCYPTGTCVLSHSCPFFLVCVTLSFFPFPFSGIRERLGFVVVALVN